MYVKSLRRMVDGGLSAAITSKEKHLMPMSFAFSVHHELVTSEGIWYLYDVNRRAAALH